MHTDKSNKYSIDPHLGKPSWWWSAVVVEPIPTGNHEEEPPLAFMPFSSLSHEAEL